MVEEPFQLIFIKIRNIVLVFLFSQASLAAVAGDILSAAGEAVDGQTAVVSTALAFRHAGGKLQLVDLFDT